MCLHTGLSYNENPATTEITSRMVNSDRIHAMLEERAVVTKILDSPPASLDSDTTLNHIATPTKDLLYQLQTHGHEHSSLPRCGLL